MNMNDVLSWIKRRIHVAYIYRSFPRFPILLVFFLFTLLGLVEGTYSYITLGIFNTSEFTNSRQTIGATIAIWSVQYFLSGPTAWLGQKCGRWRLVFLGWNIMFFFICSTCVISSIHLAVTASGDPHDRIFYGKEGRFIVLLCLQFPLYIGLSFVWANLLLLGIDKLNETPPTGEQISSYFHWSYWFKILGYTLALASTYLFSILPFPVVLTGIAFLSWLGLLVLLHPSLRSATTPNDGSPLLQLWKVTVFLIKDGYRRWKQRNQETLTESMLLVTVNEWRQPSSQFDRAKTDYRGPFDSEYVDDVKRFLHVILLLLPLLGFFAVFVLMSTAYLYQTEMSIYPSWLGNVDEIKWYVNQSTSSNITKHYHYTLPTPLLSITSYSVVLVGVALLDLVLYPCFGAYAPGIIVRIGIGLMFALIGSATATIVEIFRYSESSAVWNSYDRHCNVIQPFKDGPKAVYCGPFTFPVLAFLPQFVFLGLSLCFITIGAFEYVCGESPIHMRGILTGLLFTIRGVGYLVAAAIIFSQADYNSPESWCYFCGYPEQHQVPNSIFAYFTMFLLLLLSGGLYLWVYGSRFLKYSKDGDQVYVENLRKAFVVQARW